MIISERIVFFPAYFDYVRLCKEQHFAFNITEQKTGERDKTQSVMFQTHVR